MLFFQMRSVKLFSRSCLYPDIDFFTLIPNEHIAANIHLQEFQIFLPTPSFKKNMNSFPPIGVSVYEA